MAVKGRLASDLRFASALRRVLSRSHIYPALEHGSLDVVRFEDDFFGGTLDSNKYTVSNGGGAGAASPVITPGTLNGVADFVTGTANDDTASSELAIGLNFRGDRGAVMVACLKVSAITGVKIEVGFTDALDDPGAVATKATPTFNATDCALWVLDTSDNTNWEGLAANNGSTAPMATVEAGIAPVANTDEWLMIELLETDNSDNESSVVFSRYNGDGVRTYGPVLGGGVDGNQGPNSNVLLTPWIYVEARNGTSKTLTLDYIGAWQYRTIVQ